MKLDGYHMLCEIIDIADLKEASTAVRFFLGKAPHLGPAG